MASRWKMCGDDILHKYHNIIELALRLKCEENYEQAIEVLQPVFDKNPDDKVVVGVMAILLRESSLITVDFKRDIPVIIKSTILSPNSETASVMLFHSLWDIEDYGNAIQEAERFTRETESNSYREILEAWKSNIE